MNDFYIETVGLQMLYFSMGFLCVLGGGVGFDGSFKNISLISSRSMGITSESSKLWIY